MERSPRALGRDGEGERGMSRRRPNHHPVLGDALPPELVAGRPPHTHLGPSAGGRQAGAQRRVFQLATTRQLSRSVGHNWR